MRRVIWPVLSLVAITSAKHGKHDGMPDADDDDEVDVPAASTSSLSSTTAVAAPLSSSPSPSSSSTSSAPAASSSPFAWINPPNATTCQNTTFSWHFASSSINIAQMTLAVTNERVAQVPQQNPSSAAPPSMHIDAPLISRTLANNLSPTDDRYVWPIVDVTEGWYLAIAFRSFTPVAGHPNEANSPDMFLMRSTPFFVKNGTDVSCLAAAAASSSAVVSSPTPATSTSPSEPDTSTPVSHGGLSTVQLAGTVVGVVLGLSIIAAAFVFPRLWRRGLPKKKVPGRPYLLY
ncbi:hypothetical protein HGRIS_013570 [Hohenbuehelia grisea]|uniref:Uncharacterized protein n=1 Tax=Hohenbuehelia grisea TaxID=104357 RepID=A0ABR3IVT7_9AGAR